MAVNVRRHAGEYTFIDCRRSNFVVIVRIKWIDKVWAAERQMRSASTAGCWTM
jgi:hypothetical protein